MSTYSLEGDQSGLPHTTRTNIPYEIDQLATREAWVPRANSQTIVVRVLGEDSDQFVTDMVGRVYISDGVLGRATPEPSPRYPRLYCTRCEQYDQGDTTTDEVTGWPLPAWVRFKCTFEGLPYRVLDDTEMTDVSDEPELYRYVTRMRRPKVKEQQVPGGAMYAIPGGTVNALMSTGFKRIIFADVQYVHHRVPVANLPIANFEAAMGTYNDDLWDFGATGGYSWDEGTLLYLGYDDTDKYFDPNNDWVCDVVHSFEYKQIGWNKFMTKDWTPVEVSSDGTVGGVRPYTGSDFNTLFQYT